MSEITQQTPTRNQLFSAYDVSKIFLANTIYRAVTIANATGADLVLTVGMAIGAVGATYQVYKSGTSNIQLIGICAESLTIANGNSATVNIAIGGKVAENKLTLDGTDTLATVVAYKTIRDRFASDTLGIYFAETAELTADDNV
jgi:hypothetical protein